MIVEMRTYTLAPGATGRYFSLYAKKGLELQTRILGHLVGYYAVEVGGLNQVVHLWGYDSLEERDRRRLLLRAEQDWLDYVAEMMPMLVRQENQILTPAPFFTVPPPA